MNTGQVAALGAVAALLGTIIGAAGAILAALAGGRVQLRGQHQQWRREMRRDAYANYLGAANEFAEAIIAVIVGRLADSGPEPDEYEHFEASAEMRTARSTESDAYSLLRLEGARAVVDAAARTHDALRHWAWRTQEYWNPEVTDTAISITGIPRQFMQPLTDFPRDLSAQANLIDGRLHEFEMTAKANLENY
ncbi:hypothetical protein GCM10010277_79190 [Streptomyces longisporoflavus]|uniref:hypothetical protein n=1 Tax=Streptomyces longisporoflavus TaxID=28044 RepID=UPI00167C7B26|nr:hypothetical protein [Streptomyces longisporoflavus]GGV69192.1 hypothetical protein GCM10010277_79190 [Streptomyces longisporoflavus]